MRSDRRGASASAQRRAGRCAAAATTTHGDAHGRATKCGLSTQQVNLPAFARRDVRARETLLRSLASGLGALLVDVLDTLGSVGEHSDEVVRDLDEAPVHDKV